VFDGSLQYEIPLTIPPGRNGLQPQLSLVYSSRPASESNLFGRGWSVTIQYIERRNYAGVDELYDHAAYYSSLSGELASTTATSTFKAKYDSGEFLNYQLTSTTSSSTNTHSIDLERSSAQYLSASDSASLSVTGDLTIAAWVKPESQPSTDQEYHSVAKWDYNNNRKSYRFTVFDGGFYLVGHCHLRGAERIFAVERIRELRMLAQGFKLPPDFDAEEFLRHSWGIVRGEMVPVTVIFSRSVARYIRDRLWHPSQKLRDLPDGRLEVSLRVADTVEVRRWILGYGGEAEVVEPEGLREALRREAESLVTKLVPARKTLAKAQSREASRPMGSRGPAPGGGRRAERAGH
jgi:hypothetical protein